MQIKRAWSVLAEIARIARPNVAKLMRGVTRADARPVPVAAVAAGLCLMCHRPFALDPKMTAVLGAGLRQRRRFVDTLVRVRSLLCLSSHERL